MLSSNESFNIINACKKSVKLQQAASLATDRVLQQDSVRMSWHLPNCINVWIILLHYIQYFDVLQYMNLVYAIL